MSDESMFWADQEARKIIDRSPENKKYVCASGITPSGKVHIGNFREIMTVNLVVEALQNAGKKTRFIYSWDDFDRFRKVPKNLTPEAAREMQSRIGEPVSEIPDPYGCHESYGRHWQEPLEKDVHEVGAKPEFLYQHKIYRSGAYADGIRIALRGREVIKNIINQYRTNARGKDWYPAAVFCEKCNKDTTKITAYDNEYKINYTCECGHKNTVDFRKKGIIKLLWRADWPMRWAYYNEDFEPAGKDHFAAGSSRTTGVQIINELYNHKEPYGFMYEFVRLKGVNEKMSKSMGNIVTINDVLKIYTPQMVRYMFAGNRPRKSFEISFDSDMPKLYEDFYKTERVYYGKEKMSERDAAQNKRVYQYSYSPLQKIPKEIPSQPSIRMVSDTLQTFGNKTSAISELMKSSKTRKASDKKRIEELSEKVDEWIKEFAPEEYVYKIKSGHLRNITKEERGALVEFSEKVGSKKTEEEIKKLCSDIFTKYEIKPGRFFQICYLAMFGKEKGPRLAQYILSNNAKKIASHIKENAIGSS